MTIGDPLVGGRFVDPDGDFDGLEQDVEEHHVGRLGLQFELLLPSSARPQPDATQVPRIRIRPVIQNSDGDWVRTGTSWSKLDSLAWSRGPTDRSVEQLQVINELFAMSKLAGDRSYHRHGEDAVWLERIHSRRLWGLLGEAGDLGLPLLQAGRPAVPVDVHSSLARAAIDVRRQGAELVLQPRVTVGIDQVPLESSLVIGKPGHGIAWWDRSYATPAGTGSLHLAAFDAPVDETLRGFLGRTQVAVPDRDEERFLREIYPILLRKVVMESTDGSVDLPVPLPAKLHLFVHHLDGHRIDLAWARGGGAVSHKGLWSGSSRGEHRVTEDAMVDAVTGLVDAVPELFETTVLGRRLARRASLQGIAAAEFVTELLPALAAVSGVEIEQVGFVPAYRRVSAAPVVNLGGSGPSDHDWFDLTVTVTVDGEDVPFAELFVALAQGQSHLILPSGAFFSLDREELVQLSHLIAEARIIQDASDGTIRLSRFQASLWDELRRLGVVTAQAGRWEAAVRGLVDLTARTEYAVPDSLDAVLRPYQQTGFNWLAFLFESGLGGILADDMGLGKTLQALALMCHTRERGLTEAPYLVVAPTSVVANWASECRRFAPGLTAVAVSGTSARRRVALASLTAGADVVVTSYSLFRLEYDEYAAIPWAGLFLDEAQFAKNRNSQTFQRAKLLPVSFKVAMTGTPIENNLMELWALLSITAPGLFAYPEHFASYYRDPIEKKGDVERLAQLRRRVRPLLLRRTKEEVAKDLPDKLEQILELDLNPVQRKLYQTYLQRERQKVLGLLGDLQKHRFEIFRSLTLLRQASLDMSLVDPKHVKISSSKLDALMEMLEDIVEEGHRVLVFSQFTRFLGLARKRIESAGIECCYLDGHTSRRERVISGFRSGDAPVFLISLKAGGFGLNLVEADYCIILDPWWNPATEAQAVDRIHRIGQTKKVMVYRLVAKDTIEEKVMALKAKKAALFANVMDGSSFESGALTVADIHELLS